MTNMATVYLMILVCACMCILYMYSVLLIVYYERMKKVKLLSCASCQIGNEIRSPNLAISLVLVFVTL